MLPSVTSLLLACVAANPGHHGSADSSSDTAADPNAMDLTTDRPDLRFWRSEVPSLVSAIRTAELSYMQANGAFRETGMAPRPMSALDAVAVDWVPTQDWEDLGWAPTGRVRGDYFVDVTEGDFAVCGYSDVDDDDVIAVYVATSTSDAERMTDRHVY